MLLLRQALLQQKKTLAAATARHCYALSTLQLATATTPPFSKKSVLQFSNATHLHHKKHLQSDLPRAAAAVQMNGYSMARFSSAAAMAEYSSSDDNTDDPTTMTSLVVPPYKAIRILYASQTGTAQFMATQLAQAIEQNDPKLNNGQAVPVQVQCLSEIKSLKDLDAKALHLFVISTTGVGEFPHNGKAFYDLLLEHQQESKSSADVPTDLHYAVFALGNSQAHPQHYCAAGRELAEALYGTEATPITLGDDGNIEFGVEDAFDQWQEHLIQNVVFKQGGGGEENQSKQEQQQQEQPVVVEAAPAAPSKQVESATKTLTNDRKPMHVPLSLQPPPPLSKPLNAPDLLETYPEFYLPISRQRLRVTDNFSLDYDPVQNTAMHELHVQLPDHITYETGDHLVVYPRNPETLVRACFKLVLNERVNPNAIIQASSDHAYYPHPAGLTVYQTLSHVVDLEAPPSKAFCKWLDPELDYKRNVIQGRRTIFDLCRQYEQKLSLADLLYSLHPLQPRYYSIASSAKVHRHTAYLTYRPVHYVSKTTGTIRQGLCTSYLQRLFPGAAEIVAGVQSNPSFRLPTDSVNTPIILIAGGCGIAPIRAFLEELLVARQQTDTRNVYLFLTFRTETDQVYTDLVQQAKDSGILAYHDINFKDCGCSVSDTLLKPSAAAGLQSVLPTAHVYVCGGASEFGSAVRDTLTAQVGDSIINALQSEGRWHEDLSD